MLASSSAVAGPAMQRQRLSAGPRSKLSTRSRSCVVSRAQHEQPAAPEVARRTALLAASSLPIASQLAAGSAYAATQGTKEVLDGMYLAFNKGEIEKVLAFATPKTSWEFPSYASKQIYYGPDGFKEYVTFLFSKLEDSYVEVQDRFISGDKAVYTLKATATKSRKQGLVKAFQVAHAWAFKDGKIVSFREYSDSAALKAFMG